MPFFPNSDVVNAATETLVSLTGAGLGGVARQWHVWMEWLEANDAEFQPPPGYLEWKISIYNLVSLRYQNSWVSQTSRHESICGSLRGAVCGQTASLI